MADGVINIPIQDLKDTLQGLADIRDRIEEKTGLQRVGNEGHVGDDKLIGAVNSFDEGSEVKSQAVRAARRRVFVGVHSKFGAVSFCHFADVRDVEAIVTDTGLPVAEAQRYTLLGPQVIRVKFLAWASPSGDWPHSPRRRCSSASRRPP